LLNRPQRAKLLESLTVPAERKRGESSGPSKAYLVSFGDTMTTLLAFFIVLVSLAKEQTGANLHAGTGSFVRAVQSFGLPGIFSEKRSARATQFKAGGPKYHLEEGREPTRSHKLGSDDDSDKLPVLDRESERFQRFLQELDRVAEREELSKEVARASFDLYLPLAKQPPYLTEGHMKVLAAVLPAIRRPGYRVYLIVWAGTPSRTAWTRAARQAHVAAAYFARTASLDPAARSRLIPLGRSWIRSDVRRPVISIVVAKVE
jgi:hypothetical protein